MTFMNKSFLFIPLAIIFMSMNVHGQTLNPSVISSTGGCSTGNELSWTVGETFIETFTGGNNILFLPQ